MSSLEKIKGITKSLEDALKMIGYDSLEKLSEADPIKLKERTWLSKRDVIELVIKAKRLTLEEKLKEEDEKSRFGVEGGKERIKELERAKKEIGKSPIKAKKKKIKKKTLKKKEFKCPECGRTFNSEKGLSVHTTLVHKKPKKRRRARPKKKPKEKITETDIDSIFKELGGE